ncbi:MAG TPA: DUF2497 domain-containing protein [Stellaceae bacterium]|nr:DUF2497 domain-containing protein [Stellaceae bacterium]
MAEEKGAHEPSMEEILASIRRIIAEDETPEAGAADPKPADAASAEASLTAAASPEAAASDDVLELTEVVEEEQAVANPVEAPAQNGAEPDLRLENEPSIIEEAASASARERLISSASAAASVASLSQLVSRPRDKGAEMPLGDLGRTLEDMVRELIRPMLKTWIDENLPPLVERIVRDEITRLVREAETR